MKTNTIFQAIVILLLAFVVFDLWYYQRYSMDYAEGYEVNSPEAKQRVLIATQGSEFKDSLVGEMVQKLEGDDIYVKVIDISLLQEHQSAKWNAIVIIHTWEMWRPPKDVGHFVNDHTSSGKLILFATSGSGDSAIEGLDAITGESIIEKIPDHGGKIVERIDKLLKD